jgi:FHA domain
VQRPAQFADQPLAVNVNDLTDERGTMAVNATVAAGAERTHAVAEKRDLHQGTPVADQSEHGLNLIRLGHAQTSIDPIPKIGGGAMEERITDVENTGALPTGAESAEPPRRERPAWVDDARAGLSVPGKYLAYEESGRHIVLALSREWTRIGRSMAADLRFDDATVSRRHALVVNQSEGVRVLDDRSLNGVYVNGRRVEWSPLTDGDEVAIGRHTLHFMDTATVGSPVQSQSAVTAE